MGFFTLACATSKEDKVDAVEPDVRKTEAPKARRTSLAEKASRALEKHSPPTQPRGMAMALTAGGGGVYRLSGSASVSDSEALWFIEHRAVELYDDYIWCELARSDDEILDVGRICTVETIAVDMPVVVDDIEVKEKQVIIVVGLDEMDVPIDVHRVKGSARASAKFLSILWGIEIVEQDISPGQSISFTDSVNFHA